VNENSAIVLEPARLSLMWPWEMGRGRGELVNDDSIVAFGGGMSRRSLTLPGLIRDIAKLDPL